MKDTVRHLQRKLQQNTTDFPYDLLQPSHVSTKFAGHVGFPEQADSLAYDLVQSLLAVRENLSEKTPSLAAAGRRRFELFEEASLNI